MRRKLVVATRNPDKKKELEKLLADLSVEILNLADFPNIPEIKEKGSTFEENAISKAVFCAKRTKHISIADDSGLAVDFLKGRPGVYSARFAGRKATYEDNNKKLLRLLKDVPLNKRKAKFICCLALADSSGLIKVVKGTCA
ncbi:MAG: non-canonical purine NTP pyrophosphatase, partial [Candidatus Omnitrophica bacterium]|nr:non-canonical purine NTP pyrophosphatase [Candidatus Omnitrophota bacterium]